MGGFKIARLRDVSSADLYYTLDGGKTVEMHDGTDWLHEAADRFEKMQAVIDCARPLIDRLDTSKYSDCMVALRDALAALDMSVCSEENEK